MKTKHAIIFLMLNVVLFTACEHTEPSQELSGATCLKAVLPYYPYTIEEQFVYVNEEQNRIWEAEPRIINDKYPSVSLDDNDDFDVNGDPGKSNGNWSAKVSAYMLELNPPIRWDWSQISTSIQYWKHNKQVVIEWSLKICLSEDEHFYGFSQTVCSQNDAFSYFTDTIILTEMYSEQESVALPEGSYTRIIKDKGLTDFSVDGKTIWRRVTK